MPRTGLWANADFLRLWSAQAISAFGSRITRTALPIIAVATLGESEAIVGLLAALSLAPGAVLALFSWVLAYIFWNRGVAEVGASVAGLFMNLMPVFGVLLAWLFLDEELSPYHIAGISAIRKGGGATIVSLSVPF